MADLQAQFKVPLRVGVKNVTMFTYDITTTNANGAVRCEVHLTAPDGTKTVTEAGRNSADRSFQVQHYYDQAGTYQLQFIVWHWADNQSPDSRVDVTSPVFLIKIVDPSSPQAPDPLKISGVPVTAPIRTLDPDDDYPTAYANDIKGGAHSVHSIVDMYAIPAERREEGMICYVKGLEFYTLTGGVENDHWKPLFDVLRNVEESEASGILTIEVLNYAEYTLFYPFKYNLSLLNTYLVPNSGVTYLLGAQTVGQPLTTVTVEANTVLLVKCSFASSTKKGIVNLKITEL